LLLILPQAGCQNADAYYFFIHLFNSPLASKMTIGLVVNMVSPRLTEMLRSTLEDVETSAALPQDESALSELKHTIVRSVAELAVKRDEDCADAPSEIAPGLQQSDEETRG
jgi:hypothetical protein